MIRAYPDHPYWVKTLLESSEDVIDHQHDVFNNFAATLPPSTLFQHEGRQMADRIFNAIRNYGDLLISVDRVVIGGSMGRRTAIHEDFNPDFDLVVFLNDTGVTDRFALDCIEDAILRAGLPVDNIRRNRTSHTILCLSVYMDVNGHRVKYDILIALNMVPSTYQGSPQNYQARQVFGRLERETNSKTRKRLVYTLSSRLAEVTRACIKGKPSWMYDVVRLAKCWDKTLKANIRFEYFSGRSYLIEVIALNACKGYKPSSRSAFLGFRRFLCYMCRLGEMTVIMDPANKYNNLAENLTGYVMEQYKIYAARTLENIKVSGFNLRHINFDNFVYLLGL